MQPQFIQLGDIFLNTADIIYADFKDGESVLVVIRALDKEAYGRLFVSSEELQFGSDTPEYYALRKWLLNNSIQLTPSSQKVLEAVNND